ncbi:Gag-Pol polyprotein [Plecturocebus cupreus]
MEQIKRKADLLATALTERGGQMQQEDMAEDMAKEPMVGIEVGGQEITFMVDTDAKHSVVTQPIGPLTKMYATIIGATGVADKRPLCWSKKCDVGGWEVQHEFLYLPNCLVPLVRRDLLQKLQAQISFKPEGNVTLDLTQPAAMSGLAVNYAPVVVELKPGATLVWLHQYPLPQESVRCIWEHIEQLQKHGILVACQSPWNTPLLPVWKSTPIGGVYDYRPVQNLQAVNGSTVTIHPVMPKPYTSITFILASAA